MWAAAASLGIQIVPLPGYSPDRMPVELLWRWLREDVTDHHCHATAEDLTRRVAAFEVTVKALLGFRGDGRQEFGWRLGIASGVMKAAGD